MKKNSGIMKEIAEFPAMPALCKVLSTKLSDPNLDFNKLAKDMRYDPGMTANVLKMANSAYFGAAGKVDSLQTAIGRLGLTKVFQLIVANGIAKTLSKSLSGYDLRPEELLMHSIYVAVASEEIAKINGALPPEMLFTAGLLHDMGKIVLDPHLATARHDFPGKVLEGSIFFDLIEKDLFGIDHAEVGGSILERWNFPGELVDAARFHHNPEAAVQNRKMVYMVHLADTLSYSEGVGTGIDGLRYRTSREAFSSLGLKTSSLERVASNSLDKVREIAEVLCGGLGKVVRKSGQ